MKRLEEKICKVPKHVAIVCDGNGRWATKRGLPRKFGHREGTKVIKKIVEACNELGVEYLTLYVFSTENWTRPKEEVEYLMNLFIEFFRNFRNEARKRNLRINHIGSTNNLSEELKDEIRKTVISTKENSGLVLNLALNYGGRLEIINSIKNIIEDVEKGNIKINEIDEETFDSYLYTKGQPDPDIVIRTSGERRISNFLLWQISKSNIWIADVLFPDFKREHLIEAFVSYSKIQCQTSSNIEFNNMG